jgi:hypothetical protein
MIEIWSDANEKQFAIKIAKDDAFKSATDWSAKYVKRVEVCPYFSEYTYDWEFTLQTWLRANAPCQK